MNTTTGQTAKLFLLQNSDNSIPGLRTSSGILYVLLLQFLQTQKLLTNMYKCIKLIHTDTNYYQWRFLWT